MTEFEHVTTDGAVDIYVASCDVFDGLLSEMRELSKKKPDMTLNKGKVKILNRILTDIRGILKKEPEGKYLDLLDDDDLPQNSDAILVMVQYETALNAFKNRYYIYERRIKEHIWTTEEKLKELNEVDDGE